MAYKKTNTLTSLKRRLRAILFYGGLKYLFTTDRQIYNRIGYVKKKKKYGNGKLGNGRAKKPKLIKRKGRRCEWCREEFQAKDLTVDHIVEISEGGTNSIDNLRLLCHPCHVLRHRYEVKLSPPTNSTDK